MPDAYLLPSLLFKLSENQIALEAAIMELMDWANQCRAVEVVANMRGALETIDKNEEHIQVTLSMMIGPD